MGDLLKAYETIKAYMALLDIGILQAWEYLGEAYSKAKEKEGEA